MVFNLEIEALTASGLRDEDLIRDYLGKLDFLSRQFSPKRARDFLILTRAEELFKALWEGRPNRYQPRGHFRLDKVIDAQLSSKRGAVANCLGLTLLYNCLLKMMGIEAEALHLENAFGIGPHVLTILRSGDFIIDVENIVPDGFDYKGHKQDPSRMEWGNKELVADIYQSIGTELFEKGDFGEALRNYDMALQLNPGYEKTELNRAILLDRIKTKKQDLSTILKIKPNK
jgi:tetratricopeptide (TPR) repeat protein